MKESVRWETLLEMKDSLAWVNDEVADLRWRTMRSFNDGRSRVDTRETVVLLRALEGWAQFTACVEEAVRLHKQMLAGKEDV
jgi:hypothetical protein